MNIIPEDMTVYEYCEAHNLRLLAGHAFEWFLENLGDFPGNYLEIGVWEGVMLRELASHFPDKMFYGIDPFIEDGNTGGHYDNAAQKGETLFTQMANAKANTEGIKNIQLFQQTSSSFFTERTNAELTKMNVYTVFIDGDHSYEEARNDLFQSVRLLNNGGTIFVDDVGMPGVAAAISDFEKAFQYRFTEDSRMAVFHLKPV